MKHFVGFATSCLRELQAGVCFNRSSEGPTEAARINSLKHQLLDALAIRACVHVLGLFIKVFGP